MTRIYLAALPSRGAAIIGASIMKLWEFSKVSGVFKHAKRDLNQTHRRGFTRGRFFAYSYTVVFIPNTVDDFKI